MGRGFGIFACDADDAVTLEEANPLRPVESGTGLGLVGVVLDA